MGALVEGTMLADYRFEQYKSTPAERDAKAGDEPPKHLEALIVAAPETDANRAKELERAAERRREGRRRR